MISHPVVREDEAAGGAGARGGARRATPRSSRRSGSRPTSTGSRTSRTGASRGSSGGGTRSRRSTATRGHVTGHARRAPRGCAKCGSARRSREDPDVLDTWFSSALWPFSTLGWPERHAAARALLPGERHGDGLRHPVLLGRPHDDDGPSLHGRRAVPAHAACTALVVDETGDKMSKVKGNTIDPLDLIHGASFETVVQKALPGAPVEEALAKFKKAYPSAAQMGTGFPAYGADALRITLCSYSPQAKRIALSPKRIEGYRNFCNKIYNAVRFALGHLEGETLDRRRRRRPHAPGQPLDPVAPRRRGRGEHTRHRRVPPRRRLERALPLLLGRALRLVPRVVQAGLPGGQRRGEGRDAARPWRT